MKITKKESNVIVKWLKKNNIDTKMIPYGLVNEMNMNYLILLVDSKNKEHEIQINLHEYIYLFNKIRKVRLQDLLDKALEYENYEKACIFRDKIKEL